ncbi:hypothetical protein [Paludibacterium sp.]|nr:hypothetical protein [Paludibacterium sp.]
MLKTVLLKTGQSASTIVSGVVIRMLSTALYALTLHLARASD